MNTVNVVDNRGYTGTAEIKWMPQDEWNVAHYSAFITVPFQDSRWVNLFIFDEREISKALEKAKNVLEYALQRCTFIP